MRNRGYLPVIATLAALALALLMAGCAGGNRAPAGPLPAPEASLPPSPGRLPRQASSAGDGRFRDGSDFAAALPRHNAEPSAASLRFTPDWNLAVPGSRESAWCVYGFDLAAYDGPAEVYLQWDTGQAPAAGEWYLGVGDFESDTWQWFDGTAGTFLTLPPDLSYIRGDGAAYLVVMVLGTREAALAWVRVGGNITPTADIAADPVAGEPPLLASFSAGASRDLDGELVDYEWDLDGNGVFNEAGAEFDSRGLAAVEHTYPEAGSFSPALRITDDAGATATAATMVETSIAAVLESGSWGGEADESLNAALMDAAGNLYLAGSTQSFGNGQEDVLVLKYGPAGDLAWARCWGSVGEDRGYSLALNEAGILFVAGITTIPDGGQVALLLEYTGAGELIGSRVWGSC